MSANDLIQAFTRETGNDFIDGAEFEEFAASLHPDKADCDESDFSDNND